MARVVFQIEVRALSYLNNPQAEYMVQSTESVLYIVYISQTHLSLSVDTKLFLYSAIITAI